MKGWCGQQREAVQHGPEDARVAVQAPSGQGHFLVMEGDVGLDSCQLTIGFLKHIAIMVVWMVIRNSGIDAESTIELSQRNFEVVQSNSNYWMVC